jgi:DNA-binding transcriptional regulator YbjK
MRYHQLSEVFGHLVTLNMATLAFYERGLEVVKQERARMFLHYLIAKQKVKNEHLMASLADGSSKMFEMWFDNEIDEQLLDFIEKLTLEPTAKSDKILAVLMELNEKIEAWLTSVSSAIINSDAREYIQDLINYLSQTNQQIMHGLQRMDDV